MSGHAGVLSFKMSDPVFKRTVQPACKKWLNFRLYLVYVVY